MLGQVSHSPHSVSGAVRAPLLDVADPAQAPAGGLREGLLRVTGRLAQADEFGRGRHLFSERECVDVSLPTFRYN